LKEVRWNMGAGSILKVTNISKNFGAAVALRNVSFDLERGKILGLVREMMVLMVRAKYLCPCEKCVKHLGVKNLRCDRINKKGG